MVCIKQAKSMGFASVMTIAKGAILQGNECHNRGKGKKGAGVTVVSEGVDTKACMLEKLPLSKEDHIKAALRPPRPSYHYAPMPCSPWWPIWPSSKPCWVVILWC